jgi:hypothetical protein
LSSFQDNVDAAVLDRDFFGRLVCGLNDNAGLFKMKMWASLRIVIPKPGVWARDLRVVRSIEAEGKQQIPHPALCHASVNFSAAGLG